MCNQNKKPISSGNPQDVTDSKAHLRGASDLRLRGVAIGVRTGAVVSACDADCVPPPQGQVNWMPTTSHA